MSDELIFPGITPLWYARLAAAQGPQMSFMEKQVRRAVEQAEGAFAMACLATAPLDAAAERRGFDAGFDSFEQAFRDANRPERTRSRMRAEDVAAQVEANRSTQTKQLGATLNAAYLFAQAFLQGRVREYSLLAETVGPMSGYVIARTGLLTMAFLYRNGEAPTFLEFRESCQAEQRQHDHLRRAARPVPTIPPVASSALTRR